MNRNETVVVKILNKDYQIACPVGQQDALQESARYLDQQMNQIRKSGKVLGLDRIAVMAALNISNELIQVRNDTPAADSKQLEKINKMNEKIDDALQNLRQLEIT